jgi:hypothetical protein
MNKAHPKGGPPAKTSNGVELPTSKIERLKRAAFVAPSTLELEFVDGLRFLNAELLGIPMDQLDWSTVKVSPGGEGIVVNGVDCDSVPIDSATWLTRTTRPRSTSRLPTCTCRRPRQMKPPGSPSLHETHAGMRWAMKTIYSSDTTGHEMWTHSTSEVLSAPICQSASIQPSC